LQIRVQQNIFNIIVNPNKIYQDGFDMNVKGIIYNTGKYAIIEVFGDEPWNAFMTKLAAKDNYFNRIIMPVTLIPLDKFILFLDELIKEFFNNDKMQYVTFGKVAAQYALSPDGLYKSYLLIKDPKQLVESIAPKIWSAYFDEGVVTAKLEGNIAHFKITGLKFKHRYFEYLIMGYFQKAIKMFGKKSVFKQSHSIAAGDDHLYYQFELIDA
jgi:hypothetical protein